MTQQFHLWVYKPPKKQNSNSKDTWIPIFIAALFTIAKIWKEHECPSTDEWMYISIHLWMHTHTHIYIYIYT